MINKINIIKSKKNLEYRTPLTQEQLNQLISNKENSGQTINLCLQMPEQFEENQTYLVFSHLYKTPNQIPLINQLLSQKVRIIDYEYIKKDNKRQVSMGFISGQAAAINLLSGLGIYYLKDRKSSPFLNIKQCFRYRSYVEAQNQLKDIQISDMKIVIGMTGNGASAQGFKIIMNIIKAKIVKPDDLQKLWETDQTGVFLVIFKPKHMVEREDHAEFDKKDYYNNPEAYSAIFHKKYLQYVNVIVNCNYYDHRFPKLLTNEQLKVINLKRKQLKRTISDCMHFAIQTVINSVIPSSPLRERFSTYPIRYKFNKTYNINENQFQNGVHFFPKSLLYLSNEYYGQELSQESSQYFGNQILPYVKSLMTVDLTQNLEDQDISQELKDAVVMENGHLMDRYRNILKIQEFLNYSHIKDINKHQISQIQIDGHIFDNQAMPDLILFFQLLDIEFEISSIKAGIVRDNTSSIVITLYDTITTQNIYDLTKLCEKFSISIKFMT